MFSELPEINRIDPTPCFDCDVRLNQINCSLIKFFDCYKNREDREEFVQNLIRSFRYLPCCDIQKILLANQQESSNSKSFIPGLDNGEFKQQNDKIVVLFDKIKLNSNIDLENDECLLSMKKIVVVLFSLAKKNLNELRSVASNQLSSSSNSDSSNSSSSNRINSGQKFTTLRQSINDFLYYIRNLLLKLSSTLLNLKNGRQNFQSQHQLFVAIIQEFKNLIHFTGRISQFVENFYRQNLRKNSWTDQQECRTAFYNYFHSTVQIWWTFAEICFVICDDKDFDLDIADLLKSSNIKHHQTPFEQTLEILLYDILLLSYDRFQTIANDSSASLLIRTSPFVCSCIVEIWILAKLLLQKRSENGNLDKFFQSTFETISKIAVADDDLDNLETECLDHFKSIVVLDRIHHRNRCFGPSIGYHLYSIWIFTNLVPLLSIDIDLENDDEQESELFLSFVGPQSSNFHHQPNLSISIPSPLTKQYRLALKQFESDNSQSTDATAATISTLIHLTSKCFEFCTAPSFEVLILFVEYFLKRLNTNFNLKSSSTNHTNNNNNFATIESYQFIPKNGTDRWRQMTNEICESKQSENCFKIFLNLTSIQLKMLFAGKTTHEEEAEEEVLKFQNLNFQKFISKIVVSLQPRILRSLDLLGVFNLCSFYLVLIESIPVGRWNDISDKVLNVFNEILKNPQSQDKTSKNRTKQIELILVKFLFATISLSNELKNTNLQHHRQTGLSNYRKVCDRLAKLVNRSITESIQDSSTLNLNLEIILQYFQEMELLIQDLSFHGSSSAIDYIDCLLLSSIDLSKLYQQIFPYSNARSQSKGRSLCNNLMLDLINIVEKNLEKILFPEIVGKFIEKLSVVIRNEFHFGEDVFADLAFNCTKISFKIFSLSSPSLIQQFLTYPDSKFSSTNSAKTNTLVGCFQIRYLCLLFEDNLCFTKLINQSNTIETLLIQTWIRLLILDDLTEQLDLITEKLFGSFFDSQHRFHLSSSTKNSLDYFKLFLHSLNTNFVKLATFESKQNQIEQLSRYFRPLLTESAPLYLHNSIGPNLASNPNNNNNNNNQLFLNSKTLPPFFSNISRIFSLFSHLIQHCSKQLYVVGKSDCLLAIILETILIPTSNSFAQSNAFVNHELSFALFQKCFPLIFEGLCKLNPECDPYIERKLRQIVVFYFPFLVKNLSYEEIKKSFIRDQIYDSWCLFLDQTVEKVYLQPQRQAEPLSRSQFDYLAAYFQDQESKNRAEFYRKLSKLILLQNGSNLMNEINLAIKDYRSLLIQVIVNRAALDAEMDPDLAKDFIQSILGPFIAANLQSRPAKLFEIVKFLLPARIHRAEHQWIFRELCVELTRQLDLVERRSLSGNHSVLRKLFKEFIVNYEQSN